MFGKIRLIVSFGRSCSLALLVNYANIWSKDIPFCSVIKYSVVEYSPFKRKRISLQKTIQTFWLHASLQTIFAVMLSWANVLISRPRKVTHNVDLNANVSTLSQPCIGVARRVRCSFAFQFGVPSHLAIKCGSTTMSERVLVLMCPKPSNCTVYYHFIIQITISCFVAIWM